MSDHADTIRRIVILLKVGGEAEGAYLTEDQCRALLAERQQAIDDKEGLSAICSKWEREYVALQARCEQAIDALREIADHVPGRYVVQSPDYVQLRARARAALLNLGEQP